jgi:LDH2 family malate/lactate/ureidoglycolate dehydrogenase
LGPSCIADPTARKETFVGNVPPESGILIPAESMRELVSALFVKAGTSTQHANTMAELLVATDLRGVFSHGTSAAVGYVRLMLEGRVNARPNIGVVRETATTRVLDGDGGMGHLPCKQGTDWAIATALEMGTAAVTTRNHFHFGGASKYSRLAIEKNCIAIAASSHRFHPNPAGNVKSATGGSPVSIAIPAGRQPPLVLDMASGFLPWDPELFEKMPFPFFKDLGLGALVYSLGGVLAGIYKKEFIPPESPYESNQGAFIAIFSVEAFMDVDELHAEMDRYIGQVRNLEPFPGYDQAELPGGLEWQREKDYARDGIPVGDGHRQSLETLAIELGVEPPFQRFEHTRFSPR